MELGGVYTLVLSGVANLFFRNSIHEAGDSDMVLPRTF